MERAGALFSEVGQFLRRTFPGSTLSDGYSFILFEAPVLRRIRPGMIQPVASLMASDICWLVIVGRDPSPLVDALRFEEDWVVYNPDWNYMETKPIYACELASPPDMQALLHTTDAAEALALVSPGCKVCLHAGQRMLFAQTPGALAAFEPWLLPPEQTY